MLALVIPSWQSYTQIVWRWKPLYRLLNKCEMHESDFVTFFGCLKKYIWLNLNIFWTSEKRKRDSLQPPKDKGTSMDKKLCAVGRGKLGLVMVMYNWVGRTHILWAQYSIHAGFQFALTLLKATPLKKNALWKRDVRDGSNLLDLGLQHT